MRHTVVFPLFAVIIGIAFTTAGDKSLAVYQESTWRAVAYALVFLLTVPRFFIGNLIYYDKVHNKRQQLRENGGARRPSSYATYNLFDFYAVLIEFIIFFMLASGIGDIKQFLIALFFLSVVDVIWHLQAGIIASETNAETYSTSRCWMILNLATAIVTGWLVFDGVPNNRLDISLVFQVLVLAYFIAAIADYYWNVEFYFQPRQRERIVERLGRIEERLDILVQPAEIENLRSPD